MTEDIFADIVYGKIAYKKLGGKYLRTLDCMRRDG
jgi:hypothetical protein